jgi:hypothetical protein
MRWIFGEEGFPCLVPVSHFADIVALKRATFLTRNMVDGKGGGGAIELRGSSDAAVEKDILQQ